MASRKGVRDWLTKLNLPSGALSAFNEPDLLDDLLDHWTATDHVAERQALVRRLQVRGSMRREFAVVLVLGGGGGGIEEHTADMTAQMLGLHQPQFHNLFVNVTWLVSLLLMLPPSALG